MPKKKDKDHLITIHADQDRKFRYRNFKGKDASSYLLLPGEKLTFLAFRAAGQIAYRIEFLQESPFTCGTKEFVVERGLSRQFEISKRGIGRSFPYLVSIPALGWTDDPEIRIGMEGNSLLAADHVISSVHYFPPEGAIPGDWIFFRTYDERGELIPEFSVNFGDRSPFVNAPPVIESLCGGITQSFQLAPLEGGVPARFEYRLKVPSRGIDDPGGTITVNRPDSDGHDDIPPNYPKQTSA